MKKALPLLKTALITVGVIIGIVYLCLVFGALMSLNEKLSIYSILFLLGAVLTLPGVVLGAYKPRFGGFFLSFDSVVMLAMFFNMGLDAKYLSVFFCMYFVPVMLLGTMFLILENYHKKISKIPA
jgi:hypothetical protein